MMFNKFPVTTLIAVTLLVVTTYGYPTTESIVDDDILETTITIKPGGVYGWMKDIKNKFHEHHENCKHKGGLGVVGWVKNKLGFTTTSTTTQPIITTTAEIDFNYYHPDTTVDNTNVNESNPEDNFDTAEDRQIPENDNRNKYADTDPQSNVIIPVTERLTESIDLRNNFTNL